MNKDHFQKEIVHGIDTTFLDLTRQLDTMDFSESSNKEAVFLKILKNINQSEGVKNMKVIDSIKRVGLAVASIALVAMVGMQTTFAQDLVEKIIAKISLGHVTAIQYEANGAKKQPVPAALKGKLFDKTGKPISELTEEVNEVYTADGEEISSFDIDGEIITLVEQEKARLEDIIAVKDSNKLNEYTCFNVILPTYLPKGYLFDRAEFYKDEKGIVKDSKYIELYFTHQIAGKTIHMQQRLADEETASIMSTDGSLEKIEINGIDAILVNNRAVDWEVDGKMYFLSGAETDEAIGREELIKIAESIQ